jgi:hypothetical protein
MSNQTNYVQPIPGNPKAFSVSRIAESENDIDIIQGRIPGQFGFGSDDNIEMHFYDTDNRLVGSVVIPVSTGIISSRTILLPDGTKDEKVVIDMTRVQKELGLLVSPGTYSVTLNLFANEIGSYTNPKMIIEEVSPSRTELRLGFTTTFTQTEQTELFEFVQPSVPRVIAAGLVAGVVGVESADILDPSENNLLTPAQIQIQQFIDAVLTELQTRQPELFANLYDLEPDAVENLSLTIEYLSSLIYEEFVSLLEVTKNTKEFDRLQESEIDVLITRAVENVLTNNNINLFTQNTVRYI